MNALVVTICMMNAYSTPVSSCVTNMQVVNPQAKYLSYLRKTLKLDEEEKGPSHKL